jgi:hypothetical protein
MKRLVIVGLLLLAGCAKEEAVVVVPTPVPTPVPTATPPPVAAWVPPPTQYVDPYEGRDSGARSQPPAQQVPQPQQRTQVMGADAWPPGWEQYWRVTDAAIAVAHEAINWQGTPTYAQVVQSRASIEQAQYEYRRVPVPRDLIKVDAMMQESFSQIWLGLRAIERGIQLKHRGSFQDAREHFDNVGDLWELAGAELTRMGQRMAGQ